MTDEPMTHHYLHTHSLVPSHLLHVFNNAPQLILMSFVRIRVCVQTAGGGGGCYEAVSPKSVFEEPVQGAQRQLQSDGPVL